jgi:high-affinity nickel-transport protein
MSQDGQPSHRASDATPAGSPDALSLRGRLTGLYAVLLAANLIVWTVALFAFRLYPVLLGTCLLAYTFGLRHAVDADHIAAIDNVTRKLMHEGKRPVAVGFFFSLGHSTVVILASAALAATATALKSLDQFRTIGGLVGTLVSASFLLLIAAANILILVSVFKVFQRVKNGGAYEEEDLDLLLANRGLLSRIFKPLFGMIRQSWHMYPLGFLFGLGFDTATEIGVLGMSAAGAAQGMSIWSIMIFPLLFTAGMTLIDTTDSVLMLGAYGWAFVKPIRKLYYNMTITIVSILIALVVGGIEVLGVIGGRLGLDTGFWGVVGALNENFGTIGYVIIGIFVLSWIVSVVIYRINGYDRIEASRV